MLRRGPKALHKPAQGKRGTSAALGSHGNKRQSPEGAAQVVSPLQGLVHSSGGSQGGGRVRRGLALGWLVSGLWPGVRASAKVHDTLRGARSPFPLPLLFFPLPCQTANVSIASRFDSHPDEAPSSPASLHFSQTE